MKFDAAYPINLDPNLESTSAPAPRWMRPRTPPHLGVGDVHVWRVHVPSVRWTLPYLQQVLNAGERVRADAFRCEVERQQFVVGRASLRFILSEYLDVCAADIGFAFGVHGKPRLAEPFGCAAIEFNLSRSTDWVICAIARGRAVGIDVERRRGVPSQTAIAAQMFTAAERDDLRQAQATGPQVERFFDIWTCKEACIKALGQGLFSAFAPFEVRPDPDLAPRVPRAPAEFFPGCWSVRRLVVAADYSAALAVAGALRVTMLYECGNAFLTRRLRIEHERAGVPVRALTASTTTTHCAAQFAAS